MGAKNNNSRHLKLVLWMAGSVLVIVGAFAGWANARFNGHDSRIRTNAEDKAALKQWQADTTQRLERIENKLDERNQR